VDSVPLAGTKSKTVLIVQRQMKQYRIPFFVRLRDSLRDDSISLRVAYSEVPQPDGRSDQADLPPDLGMRVNLYRLFSSRMSYQPLLRAVGKVDLVIAEQANSYLLNYPLVLLSVFGLKRVAFWGLGESKDENRSEVGEWVRRRVLNKVDWWFTYTRSTKQYLTDHGVSEDKITVVFNAVDTLEFSELLDSLSEREILDSRRALGIGNGDPVGLFVGSLLPDKGLHFLLQAAKLVRDQITNFHLIIVGGGPEQDRVQSAARSLPWVHFLGPKFGREKALFFKMANALLLPGRVGLVILDAFAAGLPLIAVDLPYHGPEIEYLVNGKNGVLAKNDPLSYASQVISVFSSTSLQRNLRQYALDTARTHSMDAMVSNFRQGIHACLA
jgi:L-malate glycosyltransferase